MISRREIIRGQEVVPAASQKQQQAGGEPATRQRPQQKQHMGPKSGRKSASSNMTSRAKEQDSSDDYAVNQYEDYAPGLHQEGAQAGSNGADSSAGYHNFDPYSICADEEDVWYSEEKLFEDHLEEIFIKWPLLDDDIWCKLIIMERNRRIGKAYARFPMVTIDGSHELSYDGYKLALNGFDNPDRDARTEECRKRIGKGIRIKMDNFGNILIKRLSKSGVYIKEWVPSSGESNNGRVMPSRQQLIKNQNAMMAAMNNGGHRGAIGSQISSLTTSATPSSSSSGSSMDSPNDSAICDEVLNVRGRLDLDRIYVLFDVKKFQANITQELYRPYPDKRKLEQQCFSIIGLARDSDDILNMPCWVMVINIVAIEMLNERFPQIANHSSFPDMMLMENSRRNFIQPPNFVSIFEQNNNERSLKDDTNKEEDPYSLPANASSSDVKSSLNGYGATSSKDMRDSNGQPTKSSKYFGASKRAEMYAHKKGLSRNIENSITENVKPKSKSNCNIYRNGAKTNPMRYNNSSSIYSPGHMLVPPSSDSVPPKLPPRDFVKKEKSKSSSNVNYVDETIVKLDPNSESIYSTGMQQNGQEVSADGSKMRKSRKNRFLDSLKAPLELAKSSNRSNSMMGGPPPVTSEKTDKKTTTKTKSTKNLKSFLGVKGSNKTKDIASDDNNYVHVDEANILNNGTEVDSVVDPNEYVDESHQLNIDPSLSEIYNDLDIPTPDYETDENIYAIEDGNYRGISSNQKRLGANNKNLKSSRAHNKEDLYYSGFRAHVPQNITTGNLRGPSNGKSIRDDKTCSGARETSRFSMHNKMHGSKLTGQDMIYGTTTNLSSVTGSRYRSSSMQRYYSRAPATRSQVDMYDLENPYAMSVAPDLQDPYGVANSRKRFSGGKLLNPYSVNGGALHRVASSMANSNYDIGRSSSGIYGNNSSSSSSDYADWHPQMRKVNSSGYLNSIFKNHLASPIESFNSKALNHNNGNSMATYCYNNNNNNSNNNNNNNNNNKLQQKNCTSRTLQSARPASALSKQQQHQQKSQQVSSSIVNGPTYRSYDSSNDSEPSYTNSSDGLDIYDHIGAHRRLGHHQQFLATQAHELAPEVHVGEWENMYDRLAFVESEWLLRESNSSHIGSVSERYTLLKC